MFAEFHIPLKKLLPGYKLDYCYICDGRQISVRKKSENGDSLLFFIKLIPSSSDSSSCLYFLSISMGVTYEDHTFSTWLSIHKVSSSFDLINDFLVPFQSMLKEYLENDMKISVLFPEISNLANYEKDSSLND